MKIYEISLNICENQLKLHKINEIYTPYVSSCKTNIHAICVYSQAEIHAICVYSQNTHEIAISRADIPRICSEDKACPHAIRNLTIWRSRASLIGVWGLRD